MLRSTSAWVCCLLVAVAGPGLAQDGAADTSTVNMATIETWRTELSNAGRWGEDDQLGALNLITEAKRRSAAALVKDGVSVSLAHEMLVAPAPDNPSPLEHKMLADGSDANPSSYAMDSLAVAYHGFSQTHLDALCHVWHEDDMYNGHDRAKVTADGCGALDIDSIRNGVFTRGVLVDIPWVKGVPYLEPGTAITVADLEAFEAKSGVKIGPGDALLLRTGRWAMREAKGPASPIAGVAGMHASVAPLAQGTGHRAPGLRCGVRRAPFWSRRCGGAVPSASRAGYRGDGCPDHRQCRSGTGVEGSSGARPF